MTLLQPAWAPIALFAGLLTPGLAQDILVQPPTQTFSLIASQSTEAVAENFLVGSGGADLDNVLIWGTWSNTGLNNADTFDILIHDNVAGTFDDEPGSVLHSFLGVVPSMVTATGSNMPTFQGMRPEYLLEFVLPNTTLAAGTYWIEIFSTESSGSGDRFIWGMAAQDPSGGVSCVSWSTTAPGVSWNSCTPYPATDMAVLLRNAAQPDVVYCSPADMNSAGMSAAINGFAGTFTGTGVHLDCTGGVPGQFGYFLIGTAVVDPGLPISNGHLCLSTVGGNQFGRYNVNGTVMNSIGQFDASGVFQNLVGTAQSTGGPGFDLPLQIPTIGGTINPGSTWYFQMWYRDGAGGASNFSDVLEYTF